MFLRIHTISETNNCRLIDTLTTVNENYVNKLSIWAAYCIFCLAWGFSEMLAISHIHQLKNFITPKNKKIVQKDLRAKGVHNSADKVEEMHKEFITLAK